MIRTSSNIVIPTLLDGRLVDDTLFQEFANGVDHSPTTLRTLFVARAPSA
jgi:hypothetical protein